METITINILNPKAKKLLNDLVDLELISISNEKDNFLKVVKNLREKSKSVSQKEIDIEVEKIRTQLNDKK